MTSRTSKTLTTLALALVAAIAVTASAFAAYSGQPPTFIYRQTSEGVSDSFFNYDTSGPPGEDRGYKDRHRRHRGWPITIIWRGNASKYRVKRGIRMLRHPNTGANLTFRTRGHVSYEPYQILSDGKEKIRYNGSRGMKDDCGEYPHRPNTPRNFHVRFYGESRSSETAQRFFDPTGKSPAPGEDRGWNWFVVSSVHYDIAEDTNRQDAPHRCEGANKRAGYSEDATALFTDLIDSANNVESDPFGRIRRNAFPTKNNEGTDANGRAVPRPDNRGRENGNPNHIWQNDGLANVITVK